MRTPLRGLGPPGDREVSDLSTGDDHHYAMWDGAYVLGSLSAWGVLSPPGALR